MKKNYKDLTRIILSAILLVLSFFMKENSLLYFISLLGSYLIVSYELYIHAFHHMLEKEFFDENILMILATIGGFCIGEYREAVLVVLLFQIGEYLSEIVTNRTKESITGLMDLRSDVIHLIRNNQTLTVSTKNAKKGDIFEVLPGEVVPLDGTVLEGESLLDTSSLTGESIPRSISKDEPVLSGMVNIDRVLKIKATSTYETSTASKIIDLMEHSNDKKTKTEKFITRFSKIYTPIVVLLAIPIAVIPMLFGSDFEKNLYHALVFLVMSCPCALVISTPLGFFQGIGRCSREGILVKGSNELDQLTEIDTIAFDKTGTITEGTFQVTHVYTKKKKLDLLEIAAHCEVFSNHPIAKSIVSSYGKEIDRGEVCDFQESSGKGVTAKYRGVVYHLGNASYMNDQKIEIDSQPIDGTVIYVASAKGYLGYLIMNDQIKPNVRKTISSLKKLGISKILLLSGDHRKTVEEVSQKVGITEFYDSLLPQDKVAKVEELTETYKVAFVGDGMNDAPVMKCANIGISMGGVGSDIAIEASDIVLMRDDISTIPIAIMISSFTKKIVKWNIFLAISVKVLVLLLALLGFSSIWMAILADVGVTLLSVFNTFIVALKPLKKSR